MKSQADSVKGVATLQADKSVTIVKPAGMTMGAAIGLRATPSGTRAETTYGVALEEAAATVNEVPVLPT